MRVADSVGRKTGAHEQRLFYFRSSRAPLTSESTTRPRHASSSPFTSLVSVISLIVLAARSVAGCIAFTFFSLSSPVSATCSYCPRPARPAWPRQRSGNQRPQFLILLSRVLVPLFSLSLCQADRPTANRARVLSLVLPAPRPLSRPLLLFRLLAIVVARSVAASVRSLLSRLPFSLCPRQDTRPMLTVLQDRERTQVSDNYPHLLSFSRVRISSGTRTRLSITFELTTEPSQV